MLYAKSSCVAPEKGPKPAYSCGLCWSCTSLWSAKFLWYNIIPVSDQCYYTTTVAVQEIADQKSCHIESQTAKP